MLSLEPDYHQFQELFANEFSLIILMIIHQQSQKNVFPCAADISKILDIHISTVTKYLDLLSKYKLVEKETILHKPGKPTYYKSQIETLSISLEIPALTQQLRDVIQESSIPNPLIRERPNLPPRVTYDFNEEGVIESLVVKQKTRAKRAIKRRISLSKIESRFMKYLPHPTMESRQFLDVCNDAGILDAIAMKMLLSFLEKLNKYEIVEIRENKGESNE